MVNSVLLAPLQGALRHPFAHWTPRYVTDRVRRLVYEWRNPEAPWLTPEAVHFSDRMLRKSDRGLEWGSGRSTVWFAKRVGSLISVEHDQRWFAKVRSTLKAEGIKNVDYYFRAGSSQDESSPAPPDYVAVADRFPDGTFDFVLVDGLCRALCALKAVSKLKGGGLLILDNANWYLPCTSHSPGGVLPEDREDAPIWSAFRQATQAWRCLWTTDGIIDTAIWIKPDLGGIP